MWVVVNLSHLCIESGGPRWAGVDAWHGQGELVDLEMILLGLCCIRRRVNPVMNHRVGWAYLALKSSAVSLVLSICETSLEILNLVHKI